MNKRKVDTVLIAGAFLGLLLLIILSLTSIDLEEETLGSLVFTPQSEEIPLDFPVWKDDSDGKYYLFLPSWFAGETEEFSIRYNDLTAKVVIDGVTYRSGDIWPDIGGESPHSFEVYGLGGASFHTTLQVLCSENLPAVFISAEEKKEIADPDEPSLPSFLGSGPLQMFDESGALLYQGELENFKVRGNLTATFDKRPYTFTLKTPAGLLGMSPAVKWNLLANATDGTYIRNKIIRDLAYECIDTYEPQAEFIEVYLNGAYQGLYLLTEAVEIAPGRLEIDPESDWFIEMELEFRTRNDPTRMITDRGQSFIIHTDSPVTEAEKSRLLDRLNDVESALYSENGVSEISGKPLEALIDMESFAKAWLIEELSGDHDVGIASQFAYASKDPDSLWYAGPDWDFDGIMGNVNKPMYAVPEALTGTIEMSGTENDKNQNRWLASMWKHPQFQELVKKQYIEIFRDEYKKILEEKIDEYVAIIRRSSLLDSFRWHWDRISWFFTVPDGVNDQLEDSYDKYDTLDLCLAMVEDFMARKIDFLDKLWIEGRDFCIVELQNPAPFLDQGYNQTLYYWVETGTAIQNLPCYEAEGWIFDGYFDKDYHDLISDGFIIEFHRIAEGQWTYTGEGPYEYND